MKTRKKFFRAQMQFPVTEHFDLKDGVLTVTTTGRLRTDNKGDIHRDTLTEKFAPYTKYVEVDGLTLEVGLIKYEATFIDYYETLQSTDKCKMLLDEQHKRDMLWWHVEAMRTHGDFESCAIGSLYADVLHDLDLSDTEFLKKYWTDKDRRGLGRMYDDEDIKNQGIRYGYVDFKKKYKIKYKGS